jgi:hypothetical protein
VYCRDADAIVIFAAKRWRDAIYIDLRLPSLDLEVARDILHSRQQMSVRNFQHQMYQLPG